VRGVAARAAWIADPCSVLVAVAPRPQDYAISRELALWAGELARGKWGRS
jgi:hypothetical protein